HHLTGRSVPGSALPASQRKLSRRTLESRIPSPLSKTMSSKVNCSPLWTGACEVSHPVDPPLVDCSPFPQSALVSEGVGSGQLPVMPKPVPASSPGPPAQTDFGAKRPPPPAHWVVTPGVHRSKKLLFTLTGLLFLSSDMFSGWPLLKPLAER